jgi:hypothetical protein
MKKTFVVTIILIIIYFAMKKIFSGEAKSASKGLGKLGNKKMEKGKSYIEKQKWFDNEKTIVDVPKGYREIFDYIISEEGFARKAVFDVNAFRIGYGSDTITTSNNGTFRKVKEGDVTTDKLAQKDLSRRIPTEFEKNLKNQFGEIYDSLPIEAKIALNSMAYNYGSITKSKIRESIKDAANEKISWNDVAEIWINSTKDDNKSQSERVRNALKERRKREAEIIKHSGEYAI